MSTSTTSRTPTDAGSARRAGVGHEPARTALLHVRLQGDTTIIARVRSDIPLGLRQLNSTGPFARVALVQTGATLVSGDRLRLHVIVEPGASLELLEISATVAHRVSPGHWPAELVVQIELGEDARMVLAGQPLIVAAGSCVRRTLGVSLEEGAQFVHRDTVVLGRHHEAPGALFAHTRILRGDRPILDEALDTSTPNTYTTAAVLGDARVIDTLGGFGLATELPADAFALGPTDTLVRQLGATVGDRFYDLQAAWRHAVLNGPSRD